MARNWGVRGQGLGVARSLAMVLSGATLSLAYPRPEWPWLAWVSLVPLALFSLALSPRQAFFAGWLYGLGFFSLLLRWLDYTFQVYSAIPWPLTFLVVLLMSAYLACFIGAVAWATSRLNRSSGPGAALLMLPFFWVSAELLRTYLLSGFPWGVLGYSQYRRLSLIQISAWTGVYGVSWLCAATNAALVAVWTLGKKGLLFGALPLALVLFVVVAAGGRSLDRVSGERLNVAMVQANIEQGTKWEPRVQSETLARYTALTRQAAERAPDIIIWPETALPVILRREPEVIQHLVALSREVRAPLVVGSVDAVEMSDATRLYNSVFLISDQGVLRKYDKMHLVPFGEYIPMQWALGFVSRWAEFISELDSGSGPVVFRGTTPPFGTVICYEGIFPGLFRRFVSGGATWMVNVTNDGWFGTTNGPFQHLAMLPFRAVENDVSIARSANTGITTVIEPNGRIGPSLGLMEQGVLHGSLQIRRGPTWYTRYGDLFALASTGASVLAVIAGAIRRRSIEGA